MEGYKNASPSINDTLRANRVNHSAAHTGTRRKAMSASIITRAELLTRPKNSDFTTSHGLETLESLWFRALRKREEKAIYFYLILQTNT